MAVVAAAQVPVAAAVAAPVAALLPVMATLLASLIATAMVAAHPMVAAAVGVLLSPSGRALRLSLQLQLQLQPQNSKHSPLATSARRGGEQVGAMVARLVVASCSSGSV